MPKSVMKSRFQDIPKAEIPRSSFDRSHGYKTTFDAGRIIPFYCDEALPGDTFNLKLTAFARLATPIKPIMDNMFMETFFFSVPVRQIWDNWEKFNGEQTDPADSTDFLVPTVSLPQGANSESIADYFGIPLGTTGSIIVNALHFRAYNHIYNNWFRDQNLQDSLEVPTDDGPDSEALYGMRRRRKRPDYFTSCLPFPQKGESVTIPIAGRAPVASDGDDPDVIRIETPEATGNFFSLDSSGPFLTFGDGSAGPHPEALYADLEDATGVTINELRQSFQIQRLLERDARGGTRYPEILKSHFGVTDPQMLVLQRPEFLGGGSTMININPVQQTSETDTSGPDASPQGNLAAFGTASISGHGFTKSFTEHCILIGIINVRADLTYQQGLNRMWSRQTRFDYYWPALSHIGEQVVKSQEIYATGQVGDDDVFGYQERYAEYRYKPSLITGQFRSQFSQSLDIWHLSQEFEERPVLGETFILDRPPIERVIAVPSEPHFLLDCYFNLRCARPMPVYGVPGMIDHF